MIPEPIRTKRLIVAPMPKCKAEGRWYIDDLLAIYSAEDCIQYLSMGKALPKKQDIVEIIDEELENWKEPDGPRMWVAIESKLDVAVAFVRLQQASSTNVGDWEIVYAADPKYRGKGYTTEAVQAVLRYEFENGREKIVAVVEANNAPSAKLLKGLKFELLREGVNVQYEGKSFTTNDVYVISGSMLSEADT